MNTFRRILTGTALLVAACGFASADSISSNCGNTGFINTELASASVSCTQSGSLGIQVAWLNDIQLEVGGEIIGSISLTNNAGTDQLVEGTTNSNFLLASALSGFSFPSPLFNPSFNTGFETISAGGTINTTGLDSGLVTLTRTNTTNFTPYDGFGTFSVSFSTISGFGVTGGGGQISSSQTTQGEGSAFVIYDYTIPSGVPEPATYALLGSALVGLGLLRKRLTSK